MAKFEITDKMRRDVEDMAGYGVPHQAIARIIGCATATLEKHFVEELANGSAKAHAKAAKGLFIGATSWIDENRAPTRPEVALLMFYGKTRLGLRETTRHEHTGEVNVAERPTGELEAELADIQRKRAIASAGVVATRVQDKPDGVLH